MSDLISREAVIDIIHRFFTEEVDKIPTKKTEDGEVLVIHKCQPLFEMNKAICKRIKELPSVTVEPTGHWIPVSERLPEDAYGCLVTVYDTDLRTQDEFENILPYFVGYDGETWNDADGEPIPFEVIAWMPLPKPYETQERSE